MIAFRETVTARRRILVPLVFIGLGLGGLLTGWLLDVFNPRYISETSVDLRGSRETRVTVEIPKTGYYSVYLTLPQGTQPTKWPPLNVKVFHDGMAIQRPTQESRNAYSFLGYASFSAHRGESYTVVVRSDKPVDLHTFCPSIAVGEIPSTWYVNKELSMFAQVGGMLVIVGGLFFLVIAWGFKYDPLLSYSATNPRK